MGKTLDFSSTGGEILEEGMYVFSIKNVQEKVSSTKKDMWLVTFEEEETKAVIFENYVLEASCAWKVKELLQAIDVDVPDGAMELPDPSDLIGCAVKGKVIQEMYNDNLKNRMAKVFSC